MTPSDPREHAYLIIGGTTKAATTSLHTYLSDHPQVCGSSMKETRFFLDQDYPLSSKYRWTDGIEHYAEYYGHCQLGRLRVEATPDYLYSPGTPGRIRRLLPRTQMVFILRDPVGRLVSWYRFARQSDQLPMGMTFEQYVTRQLAEPASNAAPQPLRALEQGRYARYLAPYLEAFGTDGVRVEFFERLASDPVGVLGVLCRFAHLKPDFYATYGFLESNRSQGMRNPALHRAYVRTRFLIRRQTHHRRWIHQVLRGLRRIVEPLYLKLNRAEAGVEISQHLRARLAEYYSEDNERLGTLLGVPTPWGQASPNLEPNGS